MKCDTCKFYKEMPENACCAWYMDNVVCGDKKTGDCPEYIPCDDICDVFRNTADVVPKSEVERLNAVMKEMDEQRAYTINMLGESLETAKSEIEMLQGALKAEERHNELTMEMAKKALANAKAEVARKIFEEIEKIACVYKLDGDFYIDNGLYAELKKKYTEEKLCTDCKHFVGCEKAVWSGPCEEHTEKESTKNEKGVK